MKRAIGSVILTSMMLHCASRLGILDYFYQNRDAIAFQLGLTAEIPIAICNSDYHTHDLSINMTNEQAPQMLAQAQEITLFISESGTIEILPTLWFIKDITHLEALQTYNSPDLPIFHPPCLA